MDLESISSENLNKELAYLLGVYLTDGSVTKFEKSWHFTLKTIDKDFAEFTLECIKRLKPDCHASVYFQNARKRFWPNGRISKCQDQWCVSVGFGHHWGEWFKEITGDKNHFPVLIWKSPETIKKWFIAGLIDGDGFISKIDRCDGRRQYNIGIGGVEEGWIYELVELMNSLGVRTRKPERSTKGRRKPMVSVRFNLDDFIDKKFFFVLSRKQDRLKELIERRSETRRHPSRTDEGIVQTV